MELFVAAEKRIMDLVSDKISLSSSSSSFTGGHLWKERHSSGCGQGLQADCCEILKFFLFVVATCSLTFPFSLSFFSQIGTPDAEQGVHRAR